MSTSAARAVRPSPFAGARPLVLGLALVVVAFAVAFAARSAAGAGSNTSGVVSVKPLVLHSSAPPTPSFATPAGLPALRHVPKPVPAPTTAPAVGPVTAPAPAAPSGGGGAGHGVIVVG
jgi:hypothetical protein